MASSPFSMHHASAFAEDFGGANAPAAFSQNIRLKNDSRRAANIAGHDPFDEARNIDVRRTCDRAGSVKAIEAARSFDGRLPADSWAA